MRPFFQLAAWLAVLAAAFASPARAQDSAFYAVTYVELMPSESTSGTTLLKHYREVSRGEPGNLRFDVLHEIARPSRYSHRRVAASIGVRWPLYRPPAMAVAFWPAHRGAPA